MTGEDKRLLSDEQMSEMRARDAKWRSSKRIGPQHGARDRQALLLHIAALEEKLADVAELFEIADDIKRDLDLMKGVLKAHYLKSLENDSPRQE